MQFFKIALGFSALVFASATPDHNGHWDSGPKAKTCVVKAGNSTLIDDAPAILDAFDKCGHNGKIVFLNTTYHVNSVMNTTGLKNVDIDLRGTLVWSTNTSYWLNNSLPVGYQNQSSAWIFGGDNINFQGNGYGRFDGNGAAWVSCCGGKSNYPGRPHAITIINTHNSLFEGITFWKSQMWTMAIIYSSHILMQDITVNNALSRNTDGANTLFSDHITFNRWSVTGSDDSIAIKANSTNIAVTNSNFYNGLGLAFGSIGQYKDVFETIENITATNITCDKTLHAAYIKTWTGQQVGYPPNGGGGGLGYIKNVLMSDIRVTALRGFPFSITQCTTFSGVAGDCNTSLFQLSDITLTNISGTITSNPIAAIQCSAAAPCHDIVIKNVELDLVNGTEASGYLCSALRGNGTLGENGFVCTGSTCGKSSATGSC